MNSRVYDTRWSAAHVNGYAGTDQSALARTARNVAAASRFYFARDNAYYDMNRKPVDKLYAGSIVTTCNRNDGDAHCAASWLEGPNDEYHKAFYGVRESDIKFVAMSKMRSLAHAVSTQTSLVSISHSYQQLSTTGSKFQKWIDEGMPLMTQNEINREVDQAQKKVEAGVSEVMRILAGNVSSKASAFLVNSELEQLGIAYEEFVRWTTDNIIFLKREALELVLEKTQSQVAIGVSRAIRELASEVSRHTTSFEMNEAIQGLALAFEEFSEWTRERQGVVLLQSGHLEMSLGEAQSQVATSMSKVIGMLATQVSEATNSIGLREAIGQLAYAYENLSGWTEEQHGAIFLKPEHLASVVIEARIKVAIGVSNVLEALALEVSQKTTTSTLTAAIAEWHFVYTELVQQTKNPHGESYLEEASLARILLEAQSKLAAGVSNTIGELANEASQKTSSYALNETIKEIRSASQELSEWTKDNNGIIILPAEALEKSLIEAQPHIAKGVYNTIKLLAGEVDRQMTTNAITKEINELRKTYDAITKEIIELRKTNDELSLWCSNPDVVIALKDLKEANNLIHEAENTARRKGWTDHI